MNCSNKDFDCYTKGNQLFHNNCPLPQKPIFSPYNMPAGMQTGIPMFPLYGYDNSDDSDKDCEYMKNLYPKAVRSIQKEVDEECDKLEYDGSCMFDECPDKNHMNIIIDTIYVRVMDIQFDNPVLEAENFRPIMPPPPCGPGRMCPPPMPPCGPGTGRMCPPHPRPDFDHDGNPDWLRNLIAIMLFNEMNQRRRRFRSRKRWF